MPVIFKTFSSSQKECVDAGDGAVSDGDHPGTDSDKDFDNMQYLNIVRFVIKFYKFQFLRSVLFVSSRIDGFIGGVASKKFLCKVRNSFNECSFVVAVMRSSVFNFFF